MKERKKHLSGENIRRSQHENEAMIEAMSAKIAQLEIEKAQRTARISEFTQHTGVAIDEHAPLNEKISQMVQTANVSVDNRQQRL